MTEKKESQEQIIPEIEETPRQKKPRRRSFFQISKGQLILTKDLWLQKFKSNSAHANPLEQQETPLSSPVELPHIEQLQPMNTDISSEIQFHRQLSIENDPPSQDNQQVPTDGAGHPIENPQHDGNNSSDDKEAQQEQEAGKLLQEDDMEVEEEVPQQLNKDQPIVKRSSILLKLLLPKKASSPSTDDAIVTESTINESHQVELGVGSDATNDKKKATEESSATNEGKKETLDRPASPLGRRIYAVLSRIPTYKEKPSCGSEHAVNKKLPLDNVNGVDEKIKKDTTTTVTVNDSHAPDANYENEKLVSTTVAHDTIAKPSIVAV